MGASPRMGVGRARHPAPPVTGSVPELAGWERQVRGIDASDKERPVNTRSMQDVLYLVIVGVLGLYFVIGSVAWAVLAFNGKVMPEGLAATTATIGGGLIGVLSPKVKKEE